MLQGREFTEDDTSSAHCILNDLAANAIFPTHPRDVLGTSLKLSYEDADDADTSRNVCQVIGVVQATKFADVHAPKEAILFVPVTPAFLHLGGYHSNLVFLLRGSHEEAKDAAYLRVLSEIAPGTGMSVFYRWSASWLMRLDQSGSCRISRCSLALLRLYCAVSLLPPC